MTPQQASILPRKYQAYQVLRRVLAAAGQPEPDMQKIHVGTRAIREFSYYDGLTSTILDYDFPEFKGTTVLDHYTSSIGFAGIMSTQQLWLAPITVRLGQGELDVFAQEHGLAGYVNNKGAHKIDLIKAAADLFYTSFTQPAPNDHLWNLFGGGGSGYRLRFELTTSTAGQVRAIRYQQGTTLLRQINDALVQAGLPKFVLKQISRIGAFYLPLMLKPENETRLLLKRFVGGGAPTINFGQSERWPIPIGSANPMAYLKLIEIGVRYLDAATVKSSLPAWCATVPITTDK